MILAACSIAAGSMQIGTIPENAKNIGETVTINESARVVGSMTLGIVPDIIYLGDKENVSLERKIITDDGLRIPYIDVEVFCIVPDTKYTNSTDVMMLEYNSSVGYGYFEIVGGTVTETTSFTLLSTDGQPGQFGSGSKGEWYNALVKINDHWEARQL